VNFFSVKLSAEDIDKAKLTSKQNKQKSNIGFEAPNKKTCFVCSVLYRHFLKMKYIQFKLIKRSEVNAGQ
jgi:hypothetical protein